MKIEELKNKFKLKIKVDEKYSLKKTRVLSRKVFIFYFSISYPYFLRKAILKS